MIFEVSSEGLNPNSIDPKLKFVSNEVLAECMSVGVIVYSPKKAELLKALEEVYENILVESGLFLDAATENKLLRNGSTITHLTPEDLANIGGSLIWNREEDVTMSLADSIRKAMMDLGIAPDEVASEEEKPVEKSEPVKPTETPKPVEPEPEDDDIALEDYPDTPEVASEPENKVEYGLPIKPITEEEKPPVEGVTADLNVYLKIKDGTIALFIPAGFNFAKETVGGTEYSTLVFRAPDLGETGIQSLRLVNRVTPAKPEPVKPTEKPKPAKPEPVKPAEKPKPARSVTVPDVNTSGMSLEDLVKEKTRLDAEIKSARQEGDEDLVNELRKQRRKVRKQINLWGAGL